MSSANQVKIRSTEQEIPVPTGQTILAAALDAGIAFPHSCRAGKCGACKSRLIAGEVTMDKHSKFALTEEEKDQGLILACRAYPKSEGVEVSWLGEESSQASHPILRMKGVVIEKAWLTHDIVRLVIQLQDEVSFQYSAGQFVELLLPGLPPRSYSMANAAGSNRLEFHIRVVPQGKVSQYLAWNITEQDSVEIRGPFGTSHLREWHTGPILAVAGGTGLAPIQAIVERALTLGMRQQIAIFHGVREERDLYHVEKMRALEARFENFKYVPVLSSAPSNVARGTGLVGSVVLEEWKTWDELRVYLAGPPPMIDSLVSELKEKGVPQDSIHADSFYSAEADTLSDEERESEALS